jgi:hypothetical protein
MLRAVRTPVPAALLGVAAMVFGCGPAFEGPTGTGRDQLLMPDRTGWVARSHTGTTGIQGQWRAVEDGRRIDTGLPDGYCDTAPYGECSIRQEPAPGTTYGPTEGLGMCASGVLARWIAGSAGLTPDGSSGSAGIALDLNQSERPAPGAGTLAGEPYDAALHDVIGFAFDLDADPAPGAGLMIQVTSVGSKMTWHGDASPRDAKVSQVHAGRNEFTWESASQSELDRRRVLDIRFLVAGNDAHAVSYDFCIDRLTALRSAADRSGESGVRVPALAGQPLVANDTGWVDRSTTGATGIQGAWFATSDGADDGSCAALGSGECSVVIEPPGPDPRTFRPTEDLGMCTSGTIARAPDPSITWGALIALGLNQSAGADSRADAYDAERYGVTGFSFDIDSEPPPGAAIRVELPTSSTGKAAAYWGGAERDASPVRAGHNEFRWKDVGGPVYAASPPPFDPSDLIQISFHVLPNQTHAASYGYCIKNLTALRD